MTSLNDWKYLVGEIRSRLGKVFLPWVARNPQYLPGLFRLTKAHVRTHALRERQRTEGLQVPPFLVLSVTSKCNLRCLGCYAGAIGNVGKASPRPDLQLDEWRQVVKEASALGVMAFVVAGGEPFLLRGLPELFRENPDRLFLVFTNGTSISAEDKAVLRRCRNIAVMVSLEGDRKLTDGRRGEGVYEKAFHTLDQLSRAGILTGISVTIGAGNIDYWSQKANVDSFLEHCGPLAFFLEEVPTANCAEGGIPSGEQRARLRQVIEEYRGRKLGRTFILHSPDDEEALGGCVSAGKGFAHVNSRGDVTACPVSSLATHNLRAASLREALASPLFRTIRENAHILETEGHPCGLSAHASELEALTQGLGTYHTGEAEASTQDSALISIR